VPEESEKQESRLYEFCPEISVDMKCSQWCNTRKSVTTMVMALRYGI